MPYLVYVLKQLEGHREENERIMTFIQEISLASNQNVIMAMRIRSNLELAPTTQWEKNSSNVVLYMAVILARYTNCIV